jgi:DNA-binding transcriptional regulator YiaG
MGVRDTRCQNCRTTTARAFRSCAAGYLICNGARLGIRLPLWSLKGGRGTIAPMPNIASALKNEISRIARKEVRAETENLKKQSSQYRGQISKLKRQVADLEKMLRDQSKSARMAPAVPTNQLSERGGLRFRSSGFAAHRQRLGLSAAQAGALLGVSGQTVYHWEAGKSKPRASQMSRIDALRKLTKKRAAAAVAQVMGQKG